MCLFRCDWRVFYDSFTSLGFFDIFNGRTYISLSSGPVFVEAPPTADSVTEGISAAAAAADDEVGPSQSSYDKLSAPLKVLVDKLVDMGFDMGVTSRAAEHFGADEKQVHGTGTWYMVTILRKWFG